MTSTQIRRKRKHCGGYTLIELVVSMIGASVLAIGLASSLVVATQSLSLGEGDLNDSRTAHRALAQLHRDVQSALSMSELTATSVTMTVPDRDGDSVPEVIRYAWSGVAGEPLTKEYNGQTATNVAENVQAFSMAWATRFMDGVSNRPIVLFVSSQSQVDGEVTPSADEQLRADLMDDWGYQVHFISQSQSSGDFDTALNDVNVVFVSGEVTSAILSSKLNATSVGVVTESLANAVELEIHTAGVTSSSASIQIDSTSHYITEESVVGSLTIADSAEPMKRATGTVAPGATQLASVVSGTPYASLIAIEVGNELADSSSAPGRRAQLPWGDNSMDFTQLNVAGQDLMKRTIEWAAGAGGETTESGIVFEEYTEAVASGTGITISVPAGAAEGDLLIAAIAFDGDGADGLSTPSGWTSAYVGSNGSYCGIGVFWKLASSSEPASYDFSWTDSEQAYGWIMRFTGHDPATPIPTVASAADSSGTPTSPAVTTTADNSMVLRLGAFDDDDVNDGDTGLAGHTSINMNRSDTGLGTTSGGAGYVIQPTAGDSGASAFALTGSEQSMTVTLVIAPAPEE